MGNLFNMDNKFFQAISKVVDCIWLSILWVLFSIPIFTVGVSTTAMYYTVHKTIKNNRGYIWATFWTAFKANFKTSTLNWLLQLLLGIIFCMDIRLCYEFMKGGSIWGYMIFLFLILLVCDLMWAVYCAVYAARFEQDRKTLRKNAGIIAIINLPWTLLMTVIMIVSILVCIIIPYALLFFPVLTVLMLYVIFEKIFKKYMSPEDLAWEAEEYRDEGAHR